MGDSVVMKKVHPCGSYSWAVVRLGADVKIKCEGCGRLVMLTRAKLEKGLKKIIPGPGGLKEEKD